MNDLPIMSIAYDNAPVAERPVRWDMQRVLTMSTVLGVPGVIAVAWFVMTRMVVVQPCARHSAPSSHNARVRLLMLSPWTKAHCRGSIFTTYQSESHTEDDAGQGSRR